MFKNKYRYRNEKKNNSSEKEHIHKKSKNKIQHSRQSFGILVSKYFLKQNTYFTSYYRKNAFVFCREDRSVNQHKLQRHTNFTIATLIRNFILKLFTKLLLKKNCRSITGNNTLRNFTVPWL